MGCGPSSLSVQCVQGALAYTDSLHLAMAAAALSVHTLHVVLGLRRSPEVVLCH